MISRSSLELRFALPCDDWKFVVDGTPLNSQQCSANAPVASRIVYFAADHPGGEALISSFVGKDATAVFNGGVYDSNKVLFYNCF